MSRPAPKIFRRPKIAAGIMFGADMALLIGTMIAAGFSSSAEISVSYNQSEIIKHSSMEWCGLIAALALFIQCALAAVIIAGNVLCEKDRKRAAAKNTGAVLLLIFSLAVIGLFSAVSMGLPPKEARYYAYTDDDNNIVIAEEFYYFSDEGAVFVYSITGEKFDQAELLVSTQLSELSPYGERYSLEWISDNILRIAFVDNGKIRTFHIELE